MINGENIEDVDWASLAAGDESAFKRLYDRHNSVIFSVSYQVLRDKYLTEEVVQDVFVTLWENKEQLISVNNPLGYLYTIAKNKSLNCLKATARRYIKEVSVNEYLETADYGSLTEHKLLERENDTLFQQLLNLLTPQEKKVFMMSRINGQSYKEIASQLNVSDQTIKSQIATSLKKIRLSLSNSELLIILFLY